MAGAFFYNQKHGDDQAFVEAFVARHDELESLLHKLARIVSSGTTNHVVLVGARGMGKTTLLRRLAIAITQSEELGRSFLPLQFREEQYNVHTLSAFWINCGEALASWAEANGKQAFADQLDRAIESPTWRDADAAEQAFLAACRKVGARRPVLLIDNLDLVLNGLNHNERWALRRALQDEHGPVVVGAATGFLAQAANREEAFYEFFYPLPLEPLTEQQLFTCLRAMAEARPETSEPVQMILNNQSERLRTIYVLTGGNPRVLALLYRLLERGETSDVFADLEQLLDQVTPYYKARVEEYQTAQQRAVIDAIALHWDPILSRGIAEITGIEITTISTHLNRLRRDGFIQEVETSGARSGYQIAERFLNIWYLMRHGTRRTERRLKWLTVFLSRLYSPDELNAMATRARLEGEACRMHPDYRMALEEAVELSSANSLAAASDKLEARSDDPDDGPTEEIAAVIAAIAADNLEAVLSALTELEAGLVGADTVERKELQALAVFQRGFTLAQLGRLEEALAVYEDVVTRFGWDHEPEMCARVAKALLNKGVILGQLGRDEEELEIYSDMVARFGGADEVALREQVAKALVNKGVRLGRKGRNEEALAAYDEVVLHFGRDNASELREAVARAFLYKAQRLGQLGRGEAELAVYDDVVARIGGDAEVSLREHAAKALFGKGVRLGELDRGDQELAVYDEIVARFGGDSEAPLRETVAKALVNKGVGLGRLGRSAEEFAAYDEVVARFGQDKDVALRESVAAALFNKAVKHGELGRRDQELASLDEVIARFGSDSEAVPRELVAKSLITKGVRLGELGRQEDEIAVYSEVVARFRDNPEAELRETVAAAMINKGIVLGRMGRSDEQVVIYAEMVARFGEDSEVKLRDLSTRARSGLASVLIDAPKKLGDAAAMLDQVLAGPAVTFVDRANRAWVYILSGEPDGAERLVAQIQDMPPPGVDLIRAGIAFARDNLGEGLESLRQALDYGFEADSHDMFGDLVWLLRTADQRGFGERVLVWLEESRFADQYAPLVVAFRAYVRGERFLLDVSPEVRSPARMLYDRMSRHRGGSATTAERPTLARRGRPPKRRGR